MPKRFTDTGKWTDPWFCALGLQDKVFWFYILDNCDHAGFWKVNWPLVRFHIPGYEFQQEIFKGRILAPTAEKWFVPKFIQFQYGELDPASRTHASVVAILKKERVWEGYRKGIHTLKDKDKDKDMVKVKVTDNGGGVGESKPQKFDFEVIWARYPRKLTRKDAIRHFNASVKTMQDWLDIQNALDCFVRQMRKEGRPDDKIPYGGTWFNNWRDWVNYGGVQMPRAPEVPRKPVEPPPPEPTKEDLLEIHAQTVALLKRCKDGPGCPLCAVIAESKKVVANAIKTATGKKIEKSALETSDVS